MTDYAAGEADYLDSLTERIRAGGAARQAATIGEVWRDEFAATGLSTVFGAGAPLEDAYNELVNGVGAALGRPIGETLSADPQFVSGGFDAKIAAVNRLADTLPEEKRQRLDPLRDVRGRAAARAQATEAEAADTQAATYSLAGHAAAFLAGVVRQAIDPVNLAALPLGGPLKGPVVPMLLREAAIGAGVQAFQEPAIAAARRELGLDTDVLGSIAGAGLGAAGFAGLLRGGAALIGAVRSSRVTSRQSATGASATSASGQPSAPAEVAQAGEAVANGARLSEVASEADLVAAARLAERDEMIDAAAPVDTTASRIATHAAVDEAAMALEGPRRTTGGQTLGEYLRTVTPTRQMPLSAHMARFLRGEVFQPLAFDFGTREENTSGATPPGFIIRPNGERLAVRPAVVDLSNLIVSHDANGAVNPAYPAELQPRDRSSAASRSFIAERAASLEPELLGITPTAQTGAPIVGPDGVVESGNGRVLMLARAYDRHPEAASKYRAFLGAYSTEGKKFPVLVRVREGEVADRAAFAREANVSPTAGLSVTERAGADAKSLDAGLLSLWRGGDANAAANVPFVRAFAGRIVAPEERPGFVAADNRLSADGARRIEAALVARAWAAPDVVSSLYEEASPTSRAILGAMADTAPLAARLRAAIDEGRSPPEADVLAPILDAFRLVERARAAGQRVGEAVDQIDLERGAVPEPVRAAARLFFRDDALRQAAGREAVADRLTGVLGRSIDQAAGGDLFGFVLTPDANLRASLAAGQLLDDVSLGQSADRPSAVREASASSASGQPAEGERPSIPPEGPGAANGAEQNQTILDVTGPAQIALAQGFHDTRGSGARFHGSRAAGDLVFDEGHYTSEVYYGQGFYTTDAVDVGFGYTKKGQGALYQVQPKGGLKLLDMEEPVPAWLVRHIEDAPDRSSLGELAKMALDEGPANTRELYDTIRDLSRGEGASADDVQEIFEGFAEAAREQGFDGLRHIGGLRTNKPLHDVAIYFDPKTAIERTAKLDPELFRPQKEKPPKAPAAAIGSVQALEADFRRLFGRPVERLSAAEFAAKDTNRAAGQPAAIATGGRGRVSLSPSFDREAPAEQIRILAHEIGHSIEWTDHHDGLYKVLYPAPVGHKLRPGIDDALIARAKGARAARAEMRAASRAFRPVLWSRADAKPEITFDAETLKFAQVKPGTKVRAYLNSDSELFADAFALWRLDPAKAAELMPTVAPLFDRELGPKLRDQIAPENAIPQNSSSSGGPEEKSTTEAAAPDRASAGDPVLKAEADRVLDETGDLELAILDVTPDGAETARTVSARAALAESEEGAAAAAELRQCAGGTGGSEAPSPSAAQPAAVRQKPVAKAAGSGGGEKVKAYQTELEGALRDPRRFGEVFGRLSEDETLSVADMKALSKDFAKAPAKSRTEALQRIQSRHTTLMQFEAKARATDGRSAG